ncbi:hypothetical protein LFL96_24495 [Paraburkholderia sp. D15]|uniref:hypothetical protein n=1 Tax=Paraburkholderia sp. D15 TaxID=2880218 RepID=UPI002479C362|nr:hypothetical protein [Paraburkholderia sp. D15]WGS54190.1 hypothetical protein LFL96_24495 [Paraburkholderia sp. D15]
MNPAATNLPSARLDALTRTDRAQSDHARDDARSNHQATLFRGHTNFAYAHHAAAKLLANRQRASKLRARLAQTRQGQANKRARFAASKKAAAQMLRQANVRGLPQRGAQNRAGGLRVSRDGGRGGRGGQSGGGQSSQDGQKQGQGQGQGQQQQQQRREREWRHGSGERRVGDAAASRAGLDGAAMPDWLAVALEHDNGGTREHALADACCDRLLALRDEIAAAPSQRFDARLYRLAGEVTMARAWLGEAAATNFAAVRARLVERTGLRAAERGAMAGSAVGAGAETRGHVAANASPETAHARNAAAPTVDAATRVRHFNLLLGLQLFTLERRLLGSRAGHTHSTLTSLEAGAGANEAANADDGIDDIDRSSVNASANASASANANADNADHA